MADRMLGLETEYAFTALGHGGQSPDGETALRRLLQLARSKLPHLPGMHSTGIALTNSSCIYMDTGSHIEVATAECLDPWDVVRYRVAGERILADLAQSLAAEDPRISEAAFFKCNVGYASRTTWGCHESHLHRGDPAVFSREIIPHLVSRIIYSGPGGWNPQSPGLEFMLSPRVVYLVKTVSANSTCDRGIFHTKDEPLCQEGYHRLHILCGESLCSETASWLKIGTTALVVAMIEAGLRPADGVELHCPLEAMRTFSRDPECKAVAGLARWQSTTALAIQRHYLAQAEAHADEPFMPPWAHEVCREWQAVLGRLEEGAPCSVATVLDWAIKLALYKDRVCRRGFSWEALALWTRVMAALTRALEGTGHEHERLSLDFILSKGSPVASTVEGLTPLMRANGLSWDGLEAFVTLREELFEADWRFGQLGQNGIFAALDRAAVLDHHLEGVDNIEDALVHPPAAGRAHLRGECVKRFAGSGRYVCDWDRISDTEEGWVLDLSDPFETEERWQRLPKAGQDGRHRPTCFSELLEALRNRGTARTQ